MRTRKAFTLVELLVVIAIIALLISILVPSLRAARDLAKATFCKSTLNALNKAAFIYVEMNRGYMMVSDPGYYKDPMRGPDQPENASQAFGGMTELHSPPDGVKEAGTVDPATGLSSQLRTWGLVYAAKYIEPAEMFYCPGSGITASNYIKSTYPDPWGTKSTACSSQIRTSYMWNPWLKSDDSNAGSKYWYEDDCVFARHPNDRSTTCDLIFGRDATAHQQGKIASWNMGYPDGHVETFDSDAREVNSLWYYLSVYLPSIPYPDATNPGQGFAAAQMTFWGVTNTTTGKPYSYPSLYKIRRYLPGK